MSGAILCSLYMPSLPREGKLKLSSLLNFHFKIFYGYSTSRPISNSVQIKTICMAFKLGYVNDEPKAHSSNIQGLHINDKQVFRKLDCCFQLL